MTLTPNVNIELNIVESIEFSNVTYRLNLSDGRISEKVDELDSIMQAVQKVLMTERYAYVIYNDAYGVELETLIGQDKDYVRAEIPRRIKEALMIDDRIRDVVNFEIIKGEKDTMYASFDVDTIEGLVRMELEVLV